MRGPMLQALLEDRFNLKLHHETRLGPVMELTERGLPVIDKTGLDGRYDFHLEYLREGGPPAADSDPTHAALSIFTAIQRQLGLRLKPTRGPIDFIVIDHAEKPSEN